MRKHRPQGYSLGHWKVVCDRCGLTYRNDQLKLEWTGLRVCSGPGTGDCWEPRHPQDRLRGRRDEQAPPWSRPPADEIDVSPGSGNEVSSEDL